VPCLFRARRPRAPVGVDVRLRMLATPAHRLPVIAIGLLVLTGAWMQMYAVSKGADISRSTGQIWYFCFSYAVAWWVEIDRRCKGIGAPFEYSAFMFFVWPILAPYYLFTSRRWRGLVLGIALVALSLVPDVAAAALYYLVLDQ
jgi:hypothetical protein